MQLTIYPSTIVPTFTRSKTSLSWGSLWEEYDGSYRRCCKTNLLELSAVVMAWLVEWLLPTSDTWGPRFESIDRQTLYYPYINCIEKTKIKNKRLDWPIKFLLSSSTVQIWFCNFVNTATYELGLMQAFISFSVVT